jgi:hypothetical protein
LRVRKDLKEFRVLKELKVMKENKVLGVRTAIIV